MPDSKLVARFNLFFENSAHFAISAVKKVNLRDLCAFAAK